MSKAANRHGKRTAVPDAAIRKAQDEAYRLADGPERCLELWERIATPFIAPERQAEARRLFRASIQDDPFRLEFAIWCYRGALDLYQLGALD
jgi:hypothetical protein